MKFVNALLTLSLLVAAVEGGKKKKNKKNKGPKKPACQILFLNAVDTEIVPRPIQLGSKLYLVETPMTVYADGTHQVANTNIVCDAVSADPAFLFYCSYQVIFMHPHGGSEGTLTYEGLSPSNGVTTPGLLTITGGSGKYKKAKGYVNLYVPTALDGTIFKHEICFE